ncbi:MAG: hypothetical protein V9F06_02250 [Thermomicrobiales bacterium]|jgi:hypothetical protein
MPEFEDLGCVVIGLIVLLVVIALVACVAIVVVLAGAGTFIR